MTDACDEGIITYMDSVDYGKCIKVNLNKTTNTDSDTSWEMLEATSHTFSSWKTDGCAYKCKYLVKL